MQESHIDDYWNIDGSRDLSDSWTGFTQVHSVKWETSTLSSEKPPNGYVVRVEINEKTADIQVRSFVARTLERINKKC